MTMGAAIRGLCDHVFGAPFYSGDIHLLFILAWDSFHYKVDIVPTRVVYMFSTSDTYQYAATIQVSKRKAFTLNSFF